MRVLEDFRHVVFRDAARQAFGDGGLAHTGLTDQQRVILAAAAQGLNDALQFEFATDQRVYLAGLSLRVKIQRVVVQCPFVGGFLLGFSLCGFRGAGLIGAVDAVGDVVHHIQPRDAALVEEKYRMGFFLAEQGNQNVRSGDLFLVGRLHMQDGALDDALEADRGLCIHLAATGQRGVWVATKSISTARNSSMSAPQARNTCAAEGLSSMASSKCSTVMNSCRFWRASTKARCRLTSSSCAIMVYVSSSSHRSGCSRCLANAVTCATLVSAMSLGYTPHTAEPS